MDIFDLAKYYKENQGYKYILCIVDVYSRKVWTYKLKNKDNINVFESFQQFIKDSNIEKYKPTMIMSDHDSTFTRNQFKEILEKYDIIQNLNIKDDHHALGLIDSFARTLKKTLTRIFLSYNNSNWVKQLDEVVDNFNKMPNSAINNLNITSNDAFKEKSHRTIYDINYEKSLKNNSVSDLDVNDKVRILTKKLFQKGTESRYSDTVYTIKKSMVIQ
jgi:transposase InsO family protein